MPDFSETYIHRIGRTGRAGLGGTALSFCDAEEKYYLKEINKLIKIPIPVIDDHPFKLKESDDYKIEIPIKKFRTSKKEGSSHYTKNSSQESRRTKKRWVRKPKEYNKKG